MEEDSHGKGERGAGEAVGIILSGGWSVGVELYDFRDGVKTEGQATEQTVLPFTLVLMEEPPGCSIYKILQRHWVLGILT